MHGGPIRHRRVETAQIPNVVVLEKDVDERADVSCLFADREAHAGELPLEIVDYGAHSLSLRIDRRTPARSITQRAGQTHSGHGRPTVAHGAPNGYERGLTGENPGPCGGAGRPGTGGP